MDSDVCSDFEAKMRFMRLVSILCQRREEHWFLMGPFLRNMLAGMSTKGAAMHLHVCRGRYFVYNTAYLAEAAGSFVDDLEKLGVNVIERGAWTSNDWTVAKAVHKIAMPVVVDNSWTGTKEATLTPSEVHISFEHRALPSSFEAGFSCDDLALTQTGITLLNRHKELDAANCSMGIALMQRLGELRRRELRPLAKFDKVGVNAAKLLMREDGLRQDGFAIVGDGPHVTMSQEPCPICLEQNRRHVTLACRHSFCMRCIASHMQIPEPRHVQCPLCRQEIAFTPRAC